MRVEIGLDMNSSHHQLFWCSPAFSDHSTEIYKYLKCQWDCCCCCLWCQTLPKSCDIFTFWWIWSVREGCSFVRSLNLCRLENVQFTFSVDYNLLVHKNKHKAKLEVSGGSFFSIPPLIRYMLSILRWSLKVDFGRYCHNVELNEGLNIFKKL